MSKKVSERERESAWNRNIIDCVNKAAPTSTSTSSSSTSSNIEIHFEYNNKTVNSVFAFKHFCNSRWKSWSIRQVAAINIIIPQYVFHFSIVLLSVLFNIVCVGVCVFVCVYLKIIIFRKTGFILMVFLSIFGIICD